MSGGYFNYKQHHISDIANEIRELVENNTSEEVDEHGDTIGNFFSEKTIELFEDAIEVLEIASMMAQRIDWLVSGDDSEETFHERVQEEFDKLMDELDED